MSNPTLSNIKIILKNENVNTCLDIGANTGQFATLWKELFPNCRITSIEPNPYCRSRLEKLDVRYLPYGISNKSGELELISTKKKPASKGASFYKEINLNKLDDSEILRIKVPTRTLDELFVNETFDVIKIDVQGAELDVIDGGTILLSKTPFVIVEVSLVEYNEGAPLARDIIKRMEELKFFIQDIVDMHTNSKGETIQLDILFSKILDHQTQNIINFKTHLGM